MSPPKAMSEFGTSRHFAAAQQPRRFRSKADFSVMRHATRFMSTRPCPDVGSSETAVAAPPVHEADGFMP